MNNCNKYTFLNLCEMIPLKEYDYKLRPDKFQFINTIEYEPDPNIERFIFQDIKLPIGFQFKKLLEPLQTLQKTLYIRFININFNDITDFSYSFKDIYGDVYGLDTSSALNMEHMFEQSNIKLHDKLSTEKCVNMDYMFAKGLLYETYNLKIGMKNVKTFKHMFYECDGFAITQFIEYNFDDSFPIQIDYYKDDIVSDEYKPLTKFLKYKTYSDKIDLLTIYETNGKTLTNSEYNIEIGRYCDRYFDIKIYIDYLSTFDLSKIYMINEYPYEKFYVEITKYVRTLKILKKLNLSVNELKSILESIDENEIQTWHKY